MFKNLVIAFIIGLLSIVVVMSCSSGSSSTPNTNIYNLRAMLVKDVRFALTGTDNYGGTWEAVYSRTFSGDDFVNGVPVTKMSVYTYVKHIDSGTEVSGTSIEKYTSEGNMLEEVHDGIICSLTSNPDPIPTDTRVGDYGKITSTYDCSDGNTFTMDWALSDGGNGNAIAALSFVHKNSSENTIAIETDKYTITPDNEFVSLEVDINYIEDGITIHLKGNVDSTNVGLHGTYKRALFSYGNGVSLSSMADMVFLDGNVSMEGLFSTPDGANQVITLSGTYTEETDSSFIIHFGGSEVLGQLHDGGESYITTKVDSTTRQSISVGIKAGNSGYTNASLNGDYKSIMFAFSNGVPMSSMADMTFDGVDNLSITSINSTPYGITHTVETGTYVVKDDGTYIFQIGETEIVGLLDKDGKLSVAAGVDDNSTQIIVVGMKAGNTGYSNASLNGVYKRVLFAFSNGVSLSSYADMIFDGNGNITVDDVYSSPYGANQTRNMVGTYDVNDDGTFIFYFGTVEVIGLLHEDGKSYIATRVDSNSTQAITIGVKK